MSDLNWDEMSDEYRAPEPGIYRVRVAKCEQRTSQAGNEMLSFELLDADTGRKLCYDNIMLQGKGWAWPGSHKLRAILDGDKPEKLWPENLNGKIAWASLILGERRDDGRQFLEVNVRERGTAAGYWRFCNPPPEADYAADIEHGGPPEEEEKSPTVDDTPF